MRSFLVTVFVIALSACGGDGGLPKLNSIYQSDSVTNDSIAPDTDNSDDTNAEETSDSVNETTDNDAAADTGTSNDVADDGTTEVAQNLNSSGNTIRLVTWNIEHLAENNNSGCYPRDDADYEELRSFAKTLNADVVGLQEVESAAAVNRVFPESEWHVVMSNRPHNGGYRCNQNGKQSTAQKVGFAVRKGINFRHDSSDNFSDLAINNSGLRYGVIIHLTDTAPATQVMSIHMKSGCFVDDYRQSSRSACATFSRQAPVLENWMEDAAESNIPYVVLGDFNHRLAKPNNYFFQQLDDNPLLPGFSNLTHDTVGCHPRYPDPIDHVVAGPIISQAYLADSAIVHGYGKPAGQLQESQMLSDHCPISVDITL